MTVTEHIREHLFPEPSQSKKMPSLEELRKTEWSPLFEVYMRNRLIMGAFRYGPFGEDTKYDNMASVIRHVELYRETGNTEHLVDIANIAMKE